MIYVAIVKTVGDMAKPFKGVGAAYPLEVREFNSYEEAIAAHPDKQIMDIAQYRSHKDKMNALHGMIDFKPRRPWWKFWVKR